MKIGGGVAPSSLKQKEYALKLGRSGKRRGVIPKGLGAAGNTLNPAPLQFLDLIAYVCRRTPGK